MAVRLAGLFGTEPEIWVNLQARYALWFVRLQAKPKVKSLHAAARQQKTVPVPALMPKNSR